MRDRRITSDILTKTHGSLPHWQIGGHCYFVTFRSARGVLSPAARDIVVAVIRRGEGSHFLLRIAVVMPDHVHLLLLPVEKAKGIYHDLGIILGSIKATSCRLINQLEDWTGSQWQVESYDHLVRSPSDYEQCWEYIRDNPVKAGLVDQTIDYRWLFLGSKSDPDQEF